MQVFLLSLIAFLEHIQCKVWQIKLLFFVQNISTTAQQETAVCWSTKREFCTYESVTLEETN